MKSAKRKSLKRRLTIQLLLFQIGSLFIVTAAFVAYLSSGGAGSALLSPAAAQITANAIMRDKDGRLMLDETNEFVELRGSMPDFWFVAVSEKGEILHCNGWTMVTNGTSVSFLMPPMNCGPLSPFSRPVSKRCWTDRTGAGYWPMPAVSPCLPNSCSICSDLAGKKRRLFH